MRELILIAAVGNNNSLGKDNKLLWHLPDDFKHFKESTMGYPMLMGRKTFESLPGPLLGRTQIVITRDSSYQIDHKDCKLAHSIDQALELCGDATKVFVIGGGDLYRQCMDRADKILLTRVDGDFEADTFFPVVEESIWNKTDSVFHPKDSKHQYEFTIESYQRR
jgi:dihydrofolate reductase